MKSLSQISKKKLSLFLGLLMVSGIGIAIAQSWWNQNFLVTVNVNGLAVVVVLNTNTGYGAKTPSTTLGTSNAIDGLGCILAITQDAVSGQSSLLWTVVSGNMTGLTVTFHFAPISYSGGIITVGSTSGTWYLEHRNIDRTELYYSTGHGYLLWYTVVIGTGAQLGAHNLDFNLQID